MNLNVVVAASKTKPVLDGKLRPLPIILLKVPRDDRLIKVGEEADTLGISTESVQNIPNQKFIIKKLCAQWASRLLIVEKKRTRE